MNWHVSAVVVCQTKRSLEERNVELERRVEEMLDRAVSAESQRDVLQRDLTDTQTALNQLTIDTQQVLLAVVVPLTLNR